MEVKKLGELIFDEVLGGNRKHRFEDTKKDFQFNRFCDQHPHGTKVDGDLAVSVITALSDDYGDWNEAKCLMQSNADGGQIVVRLRDDRKLGRELRTGYRPRSLSHAPTTAVCLRARSRFSVIVLTRTGRAGTR